MPKTTGFRHIVNDLYRQRGIVRRTSDVKSIMNPKQYQNRLTVKQIFEEHLLPKSPSVFGEWFVATFPGAASWYAARLAYAHSAAVMSMVGYVARRRDGKDAGVCWACAERLLSVCRASAERVLSVC